MLRPLTRFGALMAVLAALSACHPNGGRQQVAAVPPPPPPPGPLEFIKKDEVSAPQPSAPPPRAGNATATASVLRIPPMALPHPQPANDSSD